MARVLRRRAQLGSLTASRREGIRCLAVLGSLLILPGLTTAQPTDDTSAVPRLPGGAPDLQGVWLYWTATPLQRPEEFADKVVVTAEEAADFVARRQDEGVTSGDWDPYTGLLNGRTSLLTDPPNGRLPARTEAAQHRADTIGRPPDTQRSADGPEDRGGWERCLMGRSVPLRPRPWAQRMQIVQNADDVVIQDEEGELRLIPLTQQPRLPEPIRQWAGSPRGHWDGDTLVVETTNFNEKWSLAGAGPNMRLVERFTRTASGTLDYEFTVHDLESFASSWTAKFPFTQDPGPIYEMACHEGNRSMVLMLNGAREQERAEHTAPQ